VRGVTPSDYPLAGLPQDSLDNLVETVGLTQLQDIYPLTALQEGMLFHSLQVQDNQDSAYFNQMLVEVEGTFDIQRFAQAWDYALSRHAILRTGFSGTKLVEPVQWVARDAELSINRLDWRGLSAEQQAHSREQTLAMDKAKGFDLTQPPLMRLTLMHLSDAHWQVLWSRHHLLLDGWSSTRLLQEVLAAYGCLMQDAQPQQHPLLHNQPKPFSDYIAWLEQQDMHAANRFWGDYLQGITQTTPSPIRHNSDTGYQYHTQTLALELSHQLEVLAQQHQVTLNTVMQGSWALLLSRYGVTSNDTQDVVFGMTSSGRPADLPEVESMLGLFINTLPIRINFDQGMELTEYLKAVLQSQMQVRDYEHMSLAQIQTWSEVNNGQALFDTFH